VFHCTPVAKINASKIVVCHETVSSSTQKNLTGNHASKCLEIQELDFGKQTSADMTAWTFRSQSSGT
jgi:hypothetical protein